MCQLQTLTKSRAMRGFGDSPSPVTHHPSRFTRRASVAEVHRDLAEKRPFGSTRSFEDVNHLACCCADSGERSNTTCMAACVVDLHLG